MRRFIQTLTDGIRKHKIAIVFAVLTSIIVASPQVYFRWDHRDDGIYQGIELLPDSFWSPRVREVQDGHPNFGSMYWKEGKDNPYLKQPLGSMFVAYMGDLFSLDINNTLLLSRVVLPFVTFLFIYWFVLLLSGSRAAGVSVASVIILADGILDPRGLLTFLGGNSPVSFLVFGQPVIPATVQLSLFGFLVSFWYYLKHGGWRLALLSAVLLGSAFYNYFYLWTYLYAFGGLLCLEYMVRGVWRNVRKLLLVYGGALIVALPYLSNLHRVTAHPLYEEVSARIGVIHTHAPLPLGIVVLASFVVFFLLFPRAERERYSFSLALLLTPLITLNQQLVTGKVLQAGHYHYYFHKPIAVALMLIAVFAYLTQRGLIIYKKALVILLIAVSLFVSIFIQYTSYTRDHVYGGNTAVERQKYGPVMKWLVVHGDKEAVVLGNDEVSQLVTIYTPLNVFYHRAASYSSLAATKERLIDIVLTLYRLRGIDDSNVVEVFTKEREQIAMDIYQLQYETSPDAIDGMPEEQFNELLSFYRASLATPTTEWLYAMFKKYDVSFVVWDSRKNPDWVVTELPYLREVFRSGDISVYSFDATQYPETVVHPMGDKNVIPKE